jgi:hypothetical protein
VEVVCDICGEIYHKKKKGNKGAIQQAREQHDSERSHSLRVRKNKPKLVVPTTEIEDN